MPQIQTEMGYRNMAQCDNYREINANIFKILSHVFAIESNKTSLNYSPAFSIQFHPKNVSIAFFFVL